MKARNSFEFAVTAVFVLIVLAAALAPGVQAARVQAQKTLISQISSQISDSQVYDAQALQAPKAEKISPFSQAKPVPAQKIGSEIDSKTAGVSNSKRSQPKARDVTCSDIHGEIDFHLQCSGNSLVTAQTSVVYGGWLDVTGVLNFTGPHSLDVWSGKLTVVDGNVLLAENGESRVARDQGYHVFVHPGASIHLTNTYVSGAADFIIQAFVIPPLADVTLQRLYYHDNEQGLYLMGSEGVVVNDSKFYDNNAFGLKIEAGSRTNANVVKNSEFYGTAPGKQNVGVIVKGRNNVIGGNNNIHDNQVGVLLNPAGGTGGNQVVNNNIHGNVKAGIKSFVPASVPDFVAPAFSGKSEVTSAQSAQPSGSFDMVEEPQPNTISGNSITGNGDGIIEYVLANNIDSAQAQLISGNNGYGVVEIDARSRPELENSLGSNGLGKMLYLSSTSVGAWIYTVGDPHLRVPDGPFYVAFCEGDIYDCDVHSQATHNDARRYEDYNVTYTRNWVWDKYFTSDLVNTSQIRYILGNLTTFTPKFLTRDHSVDNNGNTINYCSDAAHGYPYPCAFRAVSLSRYGDWLGKAADNVQPRPAYYIFYDDGVRPGGNWWGALDFDGKQNKEKQVESEAAPIIQPKRGGKRPAVKIPFVPEWRAVERG